MAYANRFINTDNLIIHLSSILNPTTNPAISSNYIGFLSVSAVTVYELAIKDIFKDFAIKKNKSFGFFVDSHFEKINGRIKLDNLKNEHISAFGEKYLTRFKKSLDLREKNSITLRLGSIKAAYGNLITCRHSFVHEGITTLSLNEVINNYTLGKEVIHSLNLAMVR